MTADWMPFGNCVAAAMLAAVAIWIVAKGVCALFRLRKVVFAGFLVASTVAAIEAQKTNNVPPNMNQPQMQQGGASFQTGFTGLTGLSGALPHIPSSLNPVNLVNPVQNNIPVQITNADISRGWRVESVTTNVAVLYAMPSNATLVGNWHKRGTFGEWMRLELGDFAFPRSGIIQSKWGQEAGMHYGARTTS